MADELDMNLIANTPPLAMWQMAGRCIGIARLMLDALALGYCGEVVVLARSLHEADRLLEAFSDPAEGKLLREWLAGGWVRPKEAREAVERSERRVAEAIRDAGGPEIGSTRQMTLQVYGEHSEASHHRRPWVQEAVAPELRTMSRGPHPAWRVRAVTVMAMCLVVEESVQIVGDALARFHGRRFYRQQVQPLIESFEAIRQSQPLS